MLLRLLLCLLPMLPPLPKKTEVSFKTSSPAGEHNSWQSFGQHLPELTETRSPGSL